MPEQMAQAEVPLAELVELMLVEHLQRQLLILVQVQAEAAVAVAVRAQVALEQLVLLLLDILLQQQLV
jgi:hypothetical protein